MTVLTLIQRHARRSNISVPSTVLGSTDEQVLQALALLEEEGNELRTRGEWQELTKEATHTTLAAESQGAISSIADGFDYFNNQTFWDRSENLPVDVIGAKSWQAEKGFANTSPHYLARIRGGLLIATPTPTAGNTWAFEYTSKNWILDTDGTTYKQYFTADTDTPVLPEELLLRGLRWRWKKEKGFAYAEDYQGYEMMVMDYLSRNGIKRPLSMDAGRKGKSPHVIVNQGSWPL